VYRRLPQCFDELGEILRRLCGIRRVITDAGKYDLESRLSRVIEEDESIDEGCDDAKFGQTAMKPSPNVTLRHIMPAKVYAAPYTRNRYFWAR
jgi:hypothetical protein